MAPAGTRKVHAGPAVISGALETNPSKCERENDISPDSLSSCKPAVTVTSAEKHLPVEGCADAEQKGTA